MPLFSEREKSGREPRRNLGPPTLSLKLSTRVAEWMPFRPRGRCMTKTPFSKLAKLSLYTFIISFLLVFIPPWHTIRWQTWNAWTKSARFLLFRLWIASPGVFGWAKNSFMFVRIAFWNAPVIFLCNFCPIMKSKDFGRGHQPGEASAHKTACSQFPRFLSLFFSTRTVSTFENAYLFIINLWLSFEKTLQETHSEIINYYKTCFCFTLALPNLHLVDGFQISKLQRSFFTQFLVHLVVTEMILEQIILLVLIAELYFRIIIRTNCQSASHGAIPAVRETGKSDRALNSPAERQRDSN